VAGFNATVPAADDENDREKLDLNVIFFSFEGVIVSVEL